MPMFVKTSRKDANLDQDGDTNRKSSSCNDDSHLLMRPKSSSQNELGISNSSQGIDLLEEYEERNISMHGISNKKVLKF